MHKILLLGLWPFAAFSTLSITIALFFLFPSHTQYKVKGAQTAQLSDTNAGYRLFTSLPSPQDTVTDDVILTDARVEIVRQFLANYDSPLEPYANLLVATAEKYNLDFRLLPAVAMQESTLCRFIPEDSYNCWGYGIYADKVIRFDSYEDAIETVGQGISQDYVYDGLSTPELIMNRYTPSSNGSWANAVRQFMEDMD